MSKFRSALFGSNRLYFGPNYDVDRYCCSRSPYRLAYLHRKARDEVDFWETEWNVADIRSAVQHVDSDVSVVLRWTRKYLPHGARLLEGGCGTGNKVWALNKDGYETVGIDFAQQTVERIKDAFPEMDVRVGNVCSLPFEDASFDGYWSLGVIEHFPDGFETLAEESHRVLRRGGVCFVTFPSVSVLRAAKCRIGAFPALPEGHDLDKQFYQYALAPDEVVKQFERIGFQCLKTHRYNGIKGFSDDVLPGRKLLRRLAASQRPTALRLKGLVNLMLNAWANHQAICVFRKED